MNRMNVILATVGTVGAVLLTGCCCYQPEVLEPPVLPIVREATIAEFDNRYVGNAPAPTFNIATFRFPSSVRSSGELPNDERFANGPFEIVNANYPVRGAQTRVVFATPPNALLAGDMIVDRIELVPQLVAHVRVAGKLLRLPDNPALLTDDAGVFAQEISRLNDTLRVDVGSTVCETLDRRAVRFGTALADPLAQQLQVEVTEGGEPSAWTYPANWPAENNQPLPLLRTPRLIDAGYYTVTMRVGEWYYYKAVNGASFFVLVTSIQDGLLAPFVERMTFKFSESYQCVNCD